MPKRKELGIINTVVLTPTQFKNIQHLIDIGQYSNYSDFICVAIRNYCNKIILKQISSEIPNWKNVIVLNDGCVKKIKIKEVK